MDFNSIANGITNVSKAFLSSPFFFTLKFILAIYVAVLFADIIMLIILRGMKDVRATFKGSNIPFVSAKKMRKKWKKIELRMKSDDLSQYKLAVIEADAIIDRIISDMRFKGNNLGERLEGLKLEQIENLEDLKGAHKVRNKIINDPSFHIEKDKAREVVKIYENFLLENEFME